MSLFPLSLLLLKFNRGRLPRASHTPLVIIFTSLGLSITAFTGIVAVDPLTAGYGLLYHMNYFIS